MRILVSVVAGLYVIRKRRKGEDGRVGEAGGCGDVETSHVVKVNRERRERGWGWGEGAGFLPQQTGLASN